MVQDERSSLNSKNKISEPVDKNNTESTLDTILNRRLESSFNCPELPKIPVVYARVRTREGKKPEAKTLKVLLDSGASATLIRGSSIKELKRTRTRNMQWRTRGGTFRTEYKSKNPFSLPELSDQKLVTWQVYVDESTTDLSYDMIIARDLLRARYNNIKF